MIRRLRAKIVGISMLTVTLVLVVGLTAVVLSVRGALVRSAEQQLYAALESSVFELVQPGQSGSAPCFVATVYTDGTVRLSGGTFGKITAGDTWTAGDLLVEGYAFQNAGGYVDCTTAASSLTNVTVVECDHNGTNGFDTNALACPYCGAPAVAYTALKNVEGNPWR